MNAVIVVGCERDCHERSQHEIDSASPWLAQKLIEPEVHPLGLEQTPGRGAPELRQIAVSGGDEGLLISGDRPRIGLQGAREEVIEARVGV